MALPSLPPPPALRLTLDAVFSLGETFRSFDAGAFVVRDRKLSDVLCVQLSNWLYQPELTGKQRRPE